MTIPGQLSPSPRLLLGPGPCDVHPRVLTVMATPLMGHLDPQFLVVMNETQEMLRRCSCSIDVIASVIPYEKYVQAETILGMSQAMGERMGIFRDPAWTQEVVARGVMREGGRIFAMTSTGDLHAWYSYGPVSAAKAALEDTIRKVDSERVLLLGGQRAILMQLAHPLVALPLWAANLFAWHVPAAYEAALASVKRVNMPDFPWTYSATAVMCAALGRWEEAHAAVLEVRRKFPAIEAALTSGEAAAGWFHDKEHGSRWRAYWRQAVAGPTAQSLTPLNARKS